MVATPLTGASLGGFPLLHKSEEFMPSGSHKDRPTRLIARSLRDGSKFRPAAARSHARRGRPRRKQRPGQGSYR
jgi:hypothetical protein